MKRKDLPSNYKYVKDYYKMLYDDLAKQYRKFVGKKCCHCKKRITLKDYDNGNVSSLVGGSCPKEGKPQHDDCYNTLMAHLFRM